MFTFETADEKEVRRFRMAQFSGKATVVSTGETTITGHVRAIREQKASASPRWIITIVPSAPRQGTASRTSAAGVHSLMDDLH